MLENSNNDENNFNQPEMDDSKEIQLSPNRKRVLNKDDNQNNNQNDLYNEEQIDNHFIQNNGINEEIEQGKKVSFNKDSNIVEEITNITMGKLNNHLEFIGKYFNVELNDIKMKLKGAIIPLNKSFHESIEIKADLYGPFWTFATIIFLIALISNLFAYLKAEDKNNFVYDFEYVPHAVFLFFGFGFGAPIILWIISKFIFKIDINLITNMCIYGYSFVILIPILILCIIPSSIIHTLGLLYFFLHTITFLFFNMFLIINQKAPKAKYFVLGLIAGIQIVLFLMLKFYFF